MIRVVNRVIAILLVGALLMTMAGCSFLSNVTAEMNTEDLLEKAVSLSGYAETGLSGQAVMGIGEGLFSEYFQIHESPLTSAEHTLKTVAAARLLGRDACGVEKFCDIVVQTIGFRCDVSAEIVVSEDLENALEDFWVATGGGKPPSKTIEQTGNISNTVKKPLARWLSAITVAYGILDEQTAQLSQQDFLSVDCFSYTHCATGDTRSVDAIRSCARKVSEAEMMRAGAMVTRATVELAKALKATKKLTRNDQVLKLKTPIGNIVLGSSKQDEYTSPEAVLLMDPSGDDVYTGRVAATESITQKISVALDLSGNDTYQSQEPSQGCGILGVGILFDLQGDDCYTAHRLAQGCSIIGTGILYDSSGEDQYTCDVTGQASGFYGLAVLADILGNDRYNGYGFVQASAGNRCTAYLIDKEGNDEYSTPRNVPEGYENLNYGGEHNGKAGNFSQGCGWGQRCVKTSQSGISGGIAGLIDLGGEDFFVGGLWVQGVGYWGGIGYVYNEGGDDEYSAYYYSQASVAHFACGMLYDVKGNDTYYLSKGAGLSFVWDRGVAMLLDDYGDDRYTCPGSHGGVANSAYDEKGLDQQDMTYAFFCDTWGNDRFESGGNTERYGFGRGGFFLDASGEDSYKTSLVYADGLIFCDQQIKKGGVFADWKDKKKTVACFGFWDKARTKQFF